MKTTDNDIRKEFEQGMADAHELQRFCPSFLQDRPETVESHQVAMMSAVEHDDPKLYAYNNGWVTAWRER